MSDIHLVGEVDVSTLTYTAGDENINMVACIVAFSVPLNVATICKSTTTWVLPIVNCNHGKVEWFILNRESDQIKVVQRTRDPRTKSCTGSDLVYSVLTHESIAHGGGALVILSAPRCLPATSKLLELVALKTAAACAGVPSSFKV